MDYKSFSDCVDFVGSACKPFAGHKKYISTGAVNTDHITEADVEIVDYDDRPSRANLAVSKGDILFAKMQGTKKTLAIDESLSNNVYSTGFCAVRAKKGILTDRCLFHLLISRSFLDQKDKNCSGATQKAITNAGLSKINVRIPDYSEQDELADKLDTLTKIINQRRIEIQHLEDLIKARFVEMFGDPETGKSIYETNKLKELSLKISDGVHAKPDYTDSGRPFLSVVNINRKKIDFSDCKYVSEEAYQKMIKSTHPERGDILYTKVGATYGIPAYVDTDTEFCLYVSVCLIKPNHEKINSRFLATQMDTPFVKHQADKRIKGIGVPDLHLNQIGDFDIICPPRQEQDDFITFVEQIDKSKFAVQKALDKAQILFDNLMQQYFG